MAMLLHRNSFRGEANRRVTDEKPLSASWYSAFALNRSTMVKKMFVASGACEGSGRREKRGSRRGAW